MEMVANEKVRKQLVVFFKGFDLNMKEFHRLAEVALCDSLNKMPSVHLAVTPVLSSPMLNHPLLHLLGDFVIVFSGFIRTLCLYSIATL